MRHGLFLISSIMNPPKHSTPAWCERIARLRALPAAFASQFPEAFEQVLRDRTGLPVADHAAVETDHGDDLGRGAGQETFVRRVDVVPCHRTFIHRETGLLRQAN